LLASLLKIGDGIIDVEQFSPFCQQHQILLMPLLAVQDKLRAAAMGRPFWKSMSERQVTLGEGRHVSLANLMLDPRDRELFYQLIHDQSTAGLRHMMKSAMEQVQQRLHMLSPDVSECAHEDAALERMFNPVWVKHHLSLDAHTEHVLHSPPPEETGDAAYAKRCVSPGAEGVRSNTQSQRRASVETVDLGGQHHSIAVERCRSNSFSEKTIVLR
jgi:predicted kinase